ncbi:MAG: hypothetical protein AB8B87_09440 [Granulosicoccus sp.]
MEWESISVTIRFELPSIWKGGVVYFGDECFKKHPMGLDLSYRASELRDLMKEEGGKEWLHACKNISADSES